MFISPRKRENDRNRSRPSLKSLGASQVIPPYEDPIVANSVKAVKLDDFTRFEVVGFPKERVRITLE
ncbi:hypothetical protein [Halohasta litchfieldiae]|jgi:hypothetical protein|uniref:hypothetical protein n=1 Tax=Halohasta litchfieldiae TaxID=1073996 RepID=UPI00115FEB84|nr:hypothetical protein [Halohasta litchfieldiae]